MKKKFRVAICDATNKKVVQQECSDGWLCLHNETKKMDKEDVKYFETTGRIKQR